MSENQVYISRAHRRGVGKYLLVACLLLCETYPHSCQSSMASGTGYFDNTANEEPKRFISYLVTKSYIYLCNLNLMFNNSLISKYDICNQKVSHLISITNCL